MSPQKKRTDIYNLKAIERKIDFDNKPQKLTTLFNGSNFYVKNSEIDEVIAIIQAESKETIKYLKSLKH